MYNTETAIIGGGLVGLATAYNILNSGNTTQIVILEKEDDIGQHQSGHNSGVIHSGIYYKPNSLKAINCIEGRRQLLEFARSENIPHEICGKVIVATSDEELPRLDELYKRGRANGLQVELIDSSTLHTYEPSVDGIKALYVPEAGIIDYKAVSKRLGELIEEAGHTILRGCKVLSTSKDSDKYIIHTSKRDVHAKYVINCAGLYSDRIARLFNCKPAVKIVPFRGEYYALKEQAHSLVKNLIYPVPDPRFPFLGVHFTRMISGVIECGPNAVLALSQEGYRWRNINIAELFSIITYRGFQKLAVKYGKEGVREMYRSFSKAAFLRSLQRLIPDLKGDDIYPIDAGVRAQAVTPDGELADDFIFNNQKNTIHVLNAPSPAATACLRIGQSIHDSFLAL